jgi:PilZ domain
MRPVLHAQCPHARKRRAARPLCEVVRLRDFRLVGRQVIDVSTRGMLIETDLSILTGEELLVAFKSPVDDRWFDCEATVVRVLQGRRRRDERRAVGISFAPMDPWTEIVLCDHLRAAPAVRAAGRLSPTRQWS